jgi:hypothetical protein
MEKTVWKTQKKQIGIKHPKKDIILTKNFVIKSHILQYSIPLFILPAILLSFFYFSNPDVPINALLYAFSFVFIIYLFLVFSEILAERLNKN